MEDAVNQYVDNKHKYNKQARHDVVNMLKVLRQNPDPVLIKEVVEILEPEHVVTNALFTDDIRVSHSVGASFISCFPQFILKKIYLSQLGMQIAPSINDKIKDPAFLVSIGESIPQCFKCDASLSDIFKYDICVLKPVVGCSSTGVCLKVNDSIRCLSNGKQYDLTNFVSKYMKEFKYDGQYIIEEFIRDSSGDPATDFKVYCFYGKAALAVELIKREGKYCYYDSNGECVDTGKYPDKLFRGEYFSKELMNRAELISLQIPTPFIRVDFLVTKERAVVGELTSNPGARESFNDMWDKILGTEFIAADARLFNDMMNGKSFTKYLDRSFNNRSTEVFTKGHNI